MWNPSSETQLINTVKDYPVIWQTRSSEKGKSKKQLSIAWDQVASSIDKTKRQARTKWSSLIRRLTKEIGLPEAERNWCHYETLSFVLRESEKIEQVSEEETELEENSIEDNKPINMAFRKQANVKQSLKIPQNKEKLSTALVEDSENDDMNFLMCLLPEFANMDRETKIKARNEVSKLVAMYAYHPEKIDDENIEKQLERKTEEKKNRCETITSCVDKNVSPLENPTSSNTDNRTSYRLQDDYSFSKDFWNNPESLFHQRELSHERQALQELNGRRALQQYKEFVPFNSTLYQMQENNRLKLLHPYEYEKFPISRYNHSRMQLDNVVDDVINPACVNRRSNSVRTPTRTPHRYDSFYLEDRFDSKNMPENLNSQRLIRKGRNQDTSNSNDGELLIPKKEVKVERNIIRPRQLEDPSDVEVIVLPDE